MERLRKSFRKKRKDRNSSGMGEEMDPSNFSVLGATAEKPPPTGRLAKIRQSFRLKNKNRRDDAGEDKKTSSEAAAVAEDALQIEAFDKKSKFRRSLSFRKKKKKPSKYETDEEEVRGGRCSFPVKYLGSLEVDESRGMEVCEAALKHLRKSGKKPLSATLHVSGDGLRVVEKKSSGMLVDQVIGKVSFCSPDRNCDKGFAYICRDGTTRRWLCHCFMSKEESGERLSHAVGVAFSICLERKQQREADCGVSMSFNEATSTFTKFGSFRQGTITERIKDPQNFKPSSPPPVQKVENPHAVARPHAPDLMFQRQASFKGFGNLSGTSPFKRGGSGYSSLRETTLPSNIQRKEKSRISLILEENFEDEELKNEINNLMTKMAKENLANKNNNNNSSNKNSNKETDTELEKQIARVQPVQLQQPVVPSPAVTPPHSSSGLHVPSVGPSHSPELKFEPAVPAAIPQSPQFTRLTVAPSVESELNTTPSPEITNLTSGGPPTQRYSSDVPQEKNPWDLVPDQSKLKQHSRSNSKVETVRDNPADSWLASLTSKISHIGDNSISYGFQGKDSEDDFDSEFAELANRNRMRNTNPFKALV